MTAPDLPITPEDVKHARDTWRAAVEARDVGAVLALYAGDGRLLGTLDTADTDRRQRSYRIRDYFEQFLDREEIRVEFRRTVTSEDVVALGPGLAAYVGYYDFVLRGGGIEEVAKAKFTFVYRRGEDGRLEILIHNSGLTPEGVR